MEITPTGTMMEQNKRLNGELEGNQELTKKAKVDATNDT